MSKVGFIMMSALVPTVGHQYLIDFARKFLSAKSDHGICDSILCVMVCSRSNEPTLGLDRVNALKEAFPNNNIIIKLYEDDFAPQSPKDENDTKFWNYWKNSIDSVFNSQSFDYVFASEEYGARLAQELNTEFIPVDIGREVFDVKGTNVRKNLIFQFNQVIPEFRKYITKNICFIGAESIGKTTMTKRLSSVYGSMWVHEWARPYLETVGAELDSNKMNNIIAGEYAALKSSVELNNKNYLIFRDTDLLATIAYFRILGWEVPEKLIECFNETKSDLYFLLKSNIPFTPDPLRYGGDKRESNDDFWRNILIEFNCNFIEVFVSDADDRFCLCYDIIEERFFDDNSVINFQRD